MRSNQSSLNSTGTFYFSNNVSQDENEREKYKNMKSIEILLEIFDEKLNRIQNEILSSNQFEIKNHIYFLQGKTGCGKSTFLPAMIWKHFNGERNVIVTEPRVNLTKTTPYNVERIFSDQPESERLTVSNQLGYITGSYKLKPRSNKSLTYMTTEILRLRLLNDNLSNDTIVIIDEVHVLSQELINLLKLIKTILTEQHSKLFFIFQSATIDIESLLEYFTNYTLDTLPDDDSKMMISIIGGVYNYSIQYVTMVSKSNHRIQSVKPKKQFDQHNRHNDFDSTHNSYDDVTESEFKKSIDKLSQEIERQRKLNPISKNNLDKFKIDPPVTLKYKSLESLRNRLVKSNETTSTSRLELDLDKFCFGLIDVILPISYNSKSTVEIKTVNSTIDSTKTVKVRDILIFTGGFDMINRIMKTLHKWMTKRENDFSPWIVNDDFQFKVLFVTNEIYDSDVKAFREKFKNETRILVIPYLSYKNNFGTYLLNHTCDPDSNSLENEIKIYLSTDALEAGKTIDTLYQVIDTGLRKEIYNRPLEYSTRISFNPKTNLPNLRENLLIEPISKDTVQQRAGRVGRRSSGISWRLFSDQLYFKMREHDNSDMIKLVCNSNVLINSVNKEIYKLTEQFEHKWIIIDPLKENDYLVPCSTDVCLKSFQDLFDSGFITSFGLPVQDIHSTDHNQIENWKLWIEYYSGLHPNIDPYLICIFARTHRKDFGKLLSPVEYPSKLKFDIDQESFHKIVVDDFNKLSIQNQVDIVIDSRQYLVEHYYKR